MCRKYKPKVVRHKSDPVKQLHIESCAVPKRTPVYPASREWVKWPKASICSTSSQRWREGEHTDSTKETTWRIVWSNDAVITARSQTLSLWCIWSSDCGEKGWRAILMWNLVVSLTNSRRSSDIFGGHNTRICIGVYFRGMRMYCTTTLSKFRKYCFVPNCVASERNSSGSPGRPVWKHISIRQSAEAILATSRTSERIPYHNCEWANWWAFECMKGTGHPSWLQVSLWYCGSSGPVLVHLFFGLPFYQGPFIQRGR
jgi:hypothetical protein